MLTTNNHHKIPISTRTQWVLLNALAYIIAFIDKAKLMMKITFMEFSWNHEMETPTMSQPLEEYPVLSSSLLE